MPDYKALYEQLFDAMTNAIESLQKAQIKAVDICIHEKREERSNKLSAQFKTDWLKKSKDD